MIILEPHKVLIQSAEGQRWIRERHERVMRYLDGFPTLRKHVLDDKWAAGFLQGWLRREGNLASFCYPSFYLEPDQLKLGIVPEDYLERAETGVRLIVDKAPKRNRNDLIGNLRAGVSASAELEVMLAWALVSQFGTDIVEPYPKVSPESGRTIDFAVVRSGKRTLIEATILLDDRDSGLQKQFCIEHGVPGTAEFRDDEADKRRLFKACHDKVHQRDITEPLVLCVNQLATWPDPAAGAEVMGRLVASEIWSRDSMMVGVAYFYSGHLVSTSFAEPRARAMGADQDVLSGIRSALCRLVDEKHVDEALAKSGKASVPETNGDRDDPGIAQAH